MKNTLLGRKFPLAAGLAAAVISGSVVVPTAQAADSIYVPLFTYRTGPLMRAPAFRSPTACRTISPC